MLFANVAQNWIGSDSELLLDHSITNAANWHGGVLPDATGDNSVYYFDARATGFKSGQVYFDHNTSVRKVEVESGNWDWIFANSVTNRVGSDQKDTLYIGYQDEATVEMSGEGTISISGDLSVGHEAGKVGKFVQRSGDVLIGDGNVAWAHIGDANGATGIVEVAGGTMSVNDKIMVGYASGAFGKMVIDGGEVSATMRPVIGYDNDSEGELILNGGALTSTKEIFIGGEDNKLRAKGSLIMNGGVLHAKSVTQIGHGADSMGIFAINNGYYDGNGDIVVGQGNRSHGTFRMNGGAVTNNYICTAWGQNSTGIVEIANGDVKLSEYVLLNRERAGAITYWNQTGGDVKVTKDFGVNGNNTTGFVNISGGGLNVNRLYVGGHYWSWGGQGDNSVVDFTLSGGIVTANNGTYLGYRSGSKGSFVLNGNGLLKTCFMRKDQGDSTLVLDGGEIRALAAGTLIGSMTHAYCGEGCTTVNNNSYDVTIDAAFANLPAEAEEGEEPSEQSGVIHYTGGGTTTIAGYSTIDKAIFENTAVVINNDAQPAKAIEIRGEVSMSGSISAPITVSADAIFNPGELTFSGNEQNPIAITLLAGSYMVTNSTVNLETANVTIDTSAGGTLVASLDEIAIYNNPLRVWIGGEEGAWDVAHNWYPARVPTAENDVLITSQTRIGLSSTDPSFRTVYLGADLTFTGNDKNHSWEFNGAFVATNLVGGTSVITNALTTDFTDSGNLIFKGRIDDGADGSVLAVHVGHMGTHLFVLENTTGSTYSGGTWLEDSRAWLGARTGALGTGPIVLNGGWLSTEWTETSVTVSLSNEIRVLENGGRIGGCAARVKKIEFHGSRFVGSGTLKLDNHSAVHELHFYDCDFSEFTGTINHRSEGSAVEVFFNDTNGTVDLANAVYASSELSHEGQTVSICGNEKNLSLLRLGALQVGTKLNFGSRETDGNVTLETGHLGLDEEFAGRWHVNTIGTLRKMGEARFVYRTLKDSSGDGLRNLEVAGGSLELAATLDNTSPYLPTQHLILSNDTTLAWNDQTAALDVSSCLQTAERATLRVAEGVSVTLANALNDETSFTKTGAGTLTLGAATIPTLTIAEGLVAFTDAAASGGTLTLTLGGETPAVTFADGTSLRETTINLNVPDGWIWDRKATYPIVSGQNLPRPQTVNGLPSGWRVRASANGLEVAPKNNLLIVVR